MYSQITFFKPAQCFWNFWLNLVNISSWAISKLKNDPAQCEVWIFTNYKVVITTLIKDIALDVLGIAPDLCTLKKENEI